MEERDGLQFIEKRRNTLNTLYKWRNFRLSMGKKCRVKNNYDYEIITYISVLLETSNFKRLEKMLHSQKTKDTFTHFQVASLLVHQLWILSGNRRSLHLLIWPLTLSATFVQFLPPPQLLSPWYRFPSRPGFPPPSADRLGQLLSNCLMIVCRVPRYNAIRTMVSTTI